MINRIIDDITAIIVLKIGCIVTSSLIIVITQCFNMLSWKTKIKKKKNLLSNFYFNLVEENFYGSAYNFYF